MRTYAFPIIAGAVLIGASLLVVAFAGSPDVPESSEYECDGDRRSRNQVRPRTTLSCERPRLPPGAFGARRPCSIDLRA